MRILRTTLLLIAAAVPVACEVYTAPPPGYGYQAQVQVQAPPPPQATVEVGAQPPPDPNAQPTADDQASDEDSGDGDASAVDDFRSVLAPYGAWMDDPQYGTIWMPSPAVVGGDFTPYMTAGHWAYDQDYTWVSDYDWGWAPFHYGRWFQYPGRGWAWIPGKQYAGAWVTWRNGDDGYGYVGWAPTPPSFYYRGGQVLVISTPWFEPAYEYAATTDLFYPSIRTRIIRDPGRIRLIASRTRPYEVRGGFVTGAGGLRMRVRGPAPTHLGIAESHVVRVQANARSLVRAQQFTHAHPPVAHVGVHTVTPTHPPLGTSQRPEMHGTMSEHASPPTTHVEAHGTSYEHAPPPSHVETRGPVMGGHGAPAPTTSNTRKPYPPPGVTHSHGTRR